jgi:hypothetical protein
VKDPTCLTHWFPKLVAAGIAVPRTELVPMPEAVLRDIFRRFDGQALTDVSKPFFTQLAAAAGRMGYPVFLRTGFTSAKHNWKDSCYLTKPEQIPDHVTSIVEYGEMMSFTGLPCDWWVVRELLPTRPMAVCPDYSDMPVCREFRAFVVDGAVRCIHPYWPMEALERGGVRDAQAVFERLSECTNEPELRTLAGAAGAAVGGYWSVDMLETDRGWMVTDMAVAKQSWHWPACEQAAALNAA